MDITLVTDVLRKALAFHPKPEIFNTDQGSQYTAKAHVDILKNIKSKSQWMKKEGLRIIFA